MQLLSVGSSIKKPVIDKGGKVVAGETLTLGLSCDHRLVDGAIGASFLGSWPIILRTLLAC